MLDTGKLPIQHNPYVFPASPVQCQVQIALFVRNVKLDSFQIWVFLATHVQPDNFQLMVPEQNVSLARGDGLREKVLVLVGYAYQDFMRRVL